MNWTPIRDVRNANTPGAHPIYDLPAEASWEGGIDPRDWRNLPEPEGDEYDDDEDMPAPQWLIDVLGFDPDEL